MTRRLDWSKAKWDSFKSQASFSSAGEIVEGDEYIERTGPPSMEAARIVERIIAGDPGFTRRAAAIKKSDKKHREKMRRAATKRLEHWKSIKTAARPKPPGPSTKKPRPSIAATPEVAAIKRHQKRLANDAKARLKKENARLRKARFKKGRRPFAVEKARLTELPRRAKRPSAKLAKSS